MAIIDSVKYNGTADTFAWKYPNEELSTWTQLIVNESQEAILFKGGQALDVFPAGRYTLSTENIPLLSGLTKLPFGGKSPFTAEVWYINKLHSLDIKWGTSTPIQLKDPEYDVFLPVRAFGQFGIQVVDSKKFLQKLVGTLPVFTKDNLVNHFRGLYLTKVKDSISGYLIKKKISILSINAYIDELSTQLKGAIAPMLAEYGIRLVSFFVNDISTPEDDSAVSQLKAAMAKRAEMRIVGYDYTQERSFDTLKAAASNEGGSMGEFMGAGMGLGMGVGVGGAMGTQFGGIAQVMNVAPRKTICPSCNAHCPEGVIYCPQCGEKLKKELPQKTCSACGKPILIDAKFCPQCGSPTKTKCPSCGSTFDGAPKFCPECGARCANNEEK